MPIVAISEDMKYLMFQFPGNDLLRMTFRAWQFKLWI